MALTKEQHLLRIKKGKQKARDQRARTKATAGTKAVRMTVVFLTQKEADEAAKLIRALPGCVWVK